MTTFDRYAEKYDSWFMKNRNVLESEVRLLRHVLGDPGECLSIGCGSGLFESLLARDHGIRIEHGAEPAAGMAEIARKRGLRVQIAGAERLPYGEASFDTALMNGLPAYLPDLGAALQEARRVLRPDGRLVVGDVPASSGYGLLYKLAGVVGTWDDPHLRKVAPPDPYPVEFVQAANWRATEEVAAAVRAAGFVALEFAQTLTTHPRFSNEAVEEPVLGYDRGGYVAIQARRG